MSENMFDEEEEKDGGCEKKLLIVVVGISSGNATKFAILFFNLSLFSSSPPLLLSSIPFYSSLFLYVIDLKLAFPLSYIAHIPHYF